MLFLGELKFFLSKYLTNSTSHSYDEPAIRSTFSIEIRHDRSYNAISNTRELSRTPEAGTNYVVTKFYEVPLVQTYLIAFIVSDFTSENDLTRKIPHRVFAKPQSIANGEGKLAVEASVKLLEGFEAYLGVNFTLDKMDQAAMPDFASGETFVLLIIQF